MFYREEAQSALPPWPSIWRGLEFWRPDCDVVCGSTLCTLVCPTIASPFPVSFLRGSWLVLFLVPAIQMNLFLIISIFDLDPERSRNYFVFCFVFIRL